MQGCDVFYLTGTDEHGEKIVSSAEKQGMTPKQFVDGLVREIKDLWTILNIQYDGFIRTTDKMHEQAASKIFDILYQKGDIYKSSYEGLYCTPCESFWTPVQAVDGKCPDCGRPVKQATEESYFFRLSKYQGRIEELLTKTDFLQPPSRVNEMVNNFIKPGLTDLAVSRSTLKWGIPVSFDKGHVIYVWIDALSNYITALGYGSEYDAKYRRYWPADLQVTAKEIVRFHSIIWPAILMALGEPPARRLFGHGWLLFSGDKMSKSKGNVIDPFVLCGRYGADAVRYYLLCALPYGADGNYTSEIMLTKINNDLVNDLGNLLSRTTAMTEQYFGAKIPVLREAGEGDAELIKLALSVLPKAKKAIDAHQPAKALEEIFALISAANKYIDLTMPWKLYKDGKTERLGAVIYNLLETLRFVGVLLKPFLPETADKIFAKLGVEGDEKQQTFASLKKFGAIISDKITKGEPVFVRLNISDELNALEDIAVKTSAAKNAAVQVSVPEAMPDGVITIDEFARVKLRVGVVSACERVPKSEKLLRLNVDDGEVGRVIVSGIAKQYAPEDLLGKDVVFVANLKPVKLCGIESRGMILCSEDEAGGLSVVRPEKAAPAGSEIR